jgi:hypothetical protein
MMEEAREVAVKAHQGQLYGDLPYIVHLDDVVDVIDECIDELLENKDLYQSRHFIFELRKILHAAGYLHDSLEDVAGHVGSYNDLKNRFNFNFPVSVADIVYACTTEKGRNREERFNDKFYLELRNTPYGSFVKGCDRISNMLASRENNPSMYKKYLTELDAFVIKAMQITERELTIIEELLLRIVTSKLKSFV